MSCCNHQLYDAAFDAKKAQADLAEYLKTGVKKTSRPFLETLQSLPLEGHALLDVGGGIGAVTFELLLNKGISKATHVEISKAYAEVFKAEAERRSLTEKVESILGNFPDLENQIQEADLVMLDKVICCYKDYEELVEASVRKARKWYVYSVPRDVWWVRLGLWVEVRIDRMKGRHFEAYIHSIEGIESIITAAGFRKKEVKFQREWRIAVFEKE